MDWRRTLPVSLLLLDGWIAIGFMPSAFMGPLSLALFASLAGIGILAGVTVKKEPGEAEQNLLALGLIAILALGIALAGLIQFRPRVLDADALEIVLAPLWAFLSGYAIGRFWSVPKGLGPEGEKKTGPATAPSVAGPGAKKNGGAT